MQIDASCYCGAVRYTVVSHTPYPYMRCYCSICRKTAGAGGYAINIMAQAQSLKVEGENQLAFHFGATDDPDRPGELNNSPAKRFFCKQCGSPLWVADPRWPEWIYPFASVVDTSLPKPPEQVHIMLDFIAPWVNVANTNTDRHFNRYPDESILDWHRRHGLYQA